jgi:hypothetical protein
MNKLLTFLLATLLFACNDAGKENQLIGEWNNLSMRIETNSKNNSDANEVFEVDQAHWEEKLKIKPIRTVFEPDSIWSSSYYNLQDSLFRKSAGKWWIEDSKLTMLQLTPSVDTTVYTFRISSDTVSFEGMLDWDSDGKKDDRYFGKQVKVKRQ